MDFITLSFLSNERASAAIAAPREADEGESDCDCGHRRRGAPHGCRLHRGRAQPDARKSGRPDRLGAGPAEVSPRELDADGEPFRPAASDIPNAPSARTAALHATRATAGPSR